MLYENCLEKLWEETKRYPGIDLVQGDSYSEGMENKNSDLQRYTEGRIRINKLFLDSKITSTPVNRLIRKEVLTENAIYFRTGILFEVYLANLHTSFLCNLIYPTFSRILLYSC